MELFVSSIHEVVVVEEYLCNSCTNVIALNLERVVAIFQLLIKMNGKNK